MERNGSFFATPHEEPWRESLINGTRTSEWIRVPEVRLVGPGEEQVGVVRVKDTLCPAEGVELDLVEVVPGAKPPVARLIDYGKYKYEAVQKMCDVRRNQASTQLKKTRFRLKTDDHGFNVKRGHAECLLSAGDKVRVIIMSRDRKQFRPRVDVHLLQRLADEVGELAIVKSMPHRDGRNMIMVLAPTKRKPDALSEQHEQRGAGREERRGKCAERVSRDRARNATTETNWRPRLFDIVAGKE